MTVGEVIELLMAIFNLISEYFGALFNNGNEEGEATAEETAE